MVRGFDDSLPRFADHGLDLWSASEEMSAAARVVRRSAVFACAASPPGIPRLVIRDLVRDGDPKCASRAAQSMVEFLQRQLAKLDHTRPGRHQRRPEVDPRLWLDRGHWAAWTICGQLVSVEEIEPGSGRGSPEVRLLEPREWPDLFAADRLVPTVIALYRGDSLDRGSVWRYMAHFDLRRALGAALEKARADEARLAAPPEPTPASAVPRRARKTRHHPLGSFIVYRRPRPDEDLPDYAAILELPPVPAAFPDRRTAQRFIQRMPRLGIDPTGLVVARVIGCVEVEPVFRPGIRVPRDPEAVLDLIRREPRVVLPELKAVWQPRYEQGEDGEWRPRSVQKRGTVRNAWSRVLLDEVTEHARAVAATLEENVIRRAAAAAEERLEGKLSMALRVAQKAERRLPGTWLDQLGMDRDSLGPDWSDVARTGPVCEAGHWLRAPCEHGRAHSDGLRSRIVELRIGDLADLLEVAGLRPRFLLLKASPRLDPEWCLLANSLGQPCDDEEEHEPEKQCESLALLARRSLA